MATDIEFKIYMPERLVTSENVYRIVLPYAGKTLTIIPERAPTILSLDMGVIRILDEHNETTEEWFVANGAVDVKENTCTILTEAAFNKKDITLEKAEELYNEFTNPFLEWIVDYLKKEQNRTKGK